MDSLSGYSNITELLPHRYPFLMVDRILEIEPGQHAKTLKCISQNEPWTTGHFGTNAIFPGVLMIETMAQTTALLLLKESEEKKEELYLAGVECVKFFQVVYPGDCLETYAKLVFSYDNLSKAECLITCENEKIAEGTLILCAR